MYHKTERPWNEQRWMMAPKEGQSVTCTAIETEKDNFTGLYDQNGVKLYRKSEPLGFVK